MVEDICAPLQNKPKPSAGCLSWHALAHCHCTLNDFATIKLLVESDKNEAKQSSHTDCHESHYAIDAHCYDWRLLAFTYSIEGVERAY